MWEEEKQEPAVALVVLFVPSFMLRPACLCNTGSRVTKATECPESGFTVDTSLSAMGHWDQIEGESGK